jgi:hypothetical protein
MVETSNRKGADSTLSKKNLSSEMNETSRYRLLHELREIWGFFMI